MKYRKKRIEHQKVFIGRYPHDEIYLMKIRLTSIPSASFSFARDIF